MENVTDSIEILSIYDFHICWKFKQESYIPRISCLSHKNRVHYLFLHLSYISQLHMFLIAAHATKFVNSCTCNYVGYKYSHSIVTKIINFTFFQNGMTAWLLICCHSIAKLSLHPLHLESYHISVHFWTLTIAHLIFFQKSVQDFCHHGGDNFFHLVLCNLYTHWRKQFHLQRNKQWTWSTKIYF